MLIEKIVRIFALVMLFCGVCFGHSHTHVGVNADGVWGNSDDDQLWIFATPDEPQWGVIEMIPTGEYIGDKQIYVAVLDCWHSAHPDSGLFQLDFNDEAMQPDWRIELKRISFSDSVNFWVEDEATTLEILTYDGATFAFEEPEWDELLPDGNGGLGAWHFHTHTEFVALADGVGETFSATFSVIDTGATGYVESAPYTLNFITVPEPASILLFGSVLFAAVRSRKGRK